MTLGQRLNSFDINRPPLAFGVQWDPSNPDPTACLSRLGDAVDLVVDTTPASSAYSMHVSDFSNHYPWAGIRRVALNKNGDYLAAHGEVDASGNTTFAEDIEKMILVEIPKFWYLIQWDVPTDCWQYWISPFPLPGYRLHPAFLRQGAAMTANMLEYIYVGAYEAYADATYPAYPSLRSAPKVAPITGQTRATYRGYAASTGVSCTQSGPFSVNGYGLMDWQTWSALQLLYLVEYASFATAPSQSTTRGGLSAGIINDTAIEKTGWTSSVDVNEHSLHSHDLGNGSGQVRCNVVNNNAVFAMSYRGIENLYGNAYTALDAINISSVDRSIWVNYTGSDMADQIAGSMGWPYVRTTYTANATSGNPICPVGWIGYQDDNWMFEKYTMGGTPSSYMCATYTVSNWSADRFPRMGGCFNSGAGGGIFCEDLAFGYGSFDAYTGVRLQYVRPNISYYAY